MRNLILVQLCLFILVISKFSHQQLLDDDEFEDDNDSLRLPQNLQPDHYLVRLQPFINGNFSIEGFVELTFNVKEPTDKIILHINDIITKNETAKVHLEGEADKILTISNQTYDVDRQFYTVDLEEELEAGRSYVFSLEYSGYLNENLKGFYRSNYEDKFGNTVWLANTQFQSTDARMAFPCFDEPGFKAKFTIEIAREEKHRAVSNMPRIEIVPVENQEGWFWDKFVTSLPMSTYLVGFIVSDFDRAEKQAHSSNNCTVRVWARSEAINDSSYALSVASHVLKYYEDYFDIPYPLPKIDLIALIDSNFGGMENWGIITFKESLLLIDSLDGKAEHYNRVCELIGHELAHMWFGDLVTPEWWGDLWLNEGFATYMQSLSIENFDPSLKKIEIDIVENLHAAFKLDSLESSHPISVEVDNPDQINELFDDITYKKGGSILRMLSNFITETTFRHALTKYLTNLSYSNAKPDDLWKYLTEEAHLEGTLDDDVTVKQIMDTWILQMGYPVINVERISINSAKISQERFLINSTSTDTDDYKWWVPLTFTTSSMVDPPSTKPGKWMKESEEEIIWDSIFSEFDTWYIFNIDQTGYYRVNYDRNNWDNLAEQLSKDHTVFSSINRGQIIDDSFNLAKAGQLPYDVPLNLLTYLAKETEIPPLAAAFGNVEYIFDLFSGKEHKKKIKEFGLHIAVPQYKRIGFKDDLSSSYKDQLQRSVVVSKACGLGYQPCVDESIRLYNEWMENPEDDTILSANVKKSIMCTAINSGNETEWNFAWERYLKAESAGEKEDMLAILVCSADEVILKRLLERAFTLGEGIRKQDAKTVIVTLANRLDVGRSLAWEFLQNEWTRIAEFYGTIVYTLSNIVKGVTDHLNTEEQLEQLKEFRRKHRGNLLSAARTVDQAIERVVNNVNWVKNYELVIYQWLEKNLVSQTEL